MVEATFLATTAWTGKRGPEDVGCGEEAELVGEEALTKEEKMPGEGEGSEARRGNGKAVARGEEGLGELEGRERLRSTWPPRRQPSDASGRRPTCTGEWGASLERGRVRTRGSLSGAREKEVERGQRQCTDQGRGQRMSCQPNLCRQTLGWGVMTLGQEGQGRRRDLRTGREGLGSGRGCRRCGWPLSWGQTHDGNDSGGEKGRCRNPERRDGPTICA